MNKKPALKFCGFLAEADVVKAVHLDIDAIGFILVPGRKRSIKKEMLPNLVRKVPERVWTVGVLQNPSIQEIEEWLSLAPLTAIQLHGGETPEFCREVKKAFGVRVIKTFHVANRIDGGDRLAQFSPWIDVALLDTGTGKTSGGSGQSFDWNQIPPFYEQCRMLGVPLWVAGGLNALNVTSLIKRYRLDGVDVSSGIEADGRKNADLMAQFVERVKSCENR
ncbi:MAG: phosphoribosylanthranilate isomerase [Thermoactinomyces sp.]